MNKTAVFRIVLIVFVLAVGVLQIIQTHKQIESQKVMDKRITEARVELSDALTGVAFKAGANVGMWCAQTVLHATLYVGSDLGPCEAAQLKGRAGLDWYNAHKDTWVVGKK